MDKVEDLVTDRQLELAFLNTNFGERLTKRQIVANTILKCAAGYSTGHTAKCIAEELGLVTPSWELSHRGKLYLYAAYAGGVSV